MNKQDITSIKQLLSTPKKIVIVPHKNPDGDAIGSTLGLYHYLIKGQHEVNVLVPNDYPKFLKWIPGNDTILKHDTQSRVARVFPDENFQRRHRLFPPVLKKHAGLLHFSNSERYFFCWDLRLKNKRLHFFVRVIWVVILFAVVIGAMSYL